MQPGQRFEPGQASGDTPDGTDPATNKDAQTNDTNVTPPAPEPVSTGDQADASDITPPINTDGATDNVSTTPASDEATAPPADTPSEPTPEAEQSSDDQGRADTTPPPVAPTGSSSTAAESDNPSTDVAQPDPQENKAPDVPPDSDDSTNPKDEPVNPAQFNWEASEYVEHHHSPLWYGVLIFVTSALVALAVLVFDEILSAVVVVLMAVSIVVYAHRRPQTLNYQVNAAGVSIGEKHYPYTDFKSFAVLPTQSLVTVELDPVKRFMPRLSIILGQNQAGTAINVLAQHLPHEDRQPEFVDRLAHSLKF